GGDHDLVEYTALHGAAPDPLDERPAGDGVQGLAGEPGRCEAGRDHREDLGGHRVAGPLRGESGRRAIAIITPSNLTRVHPNVKALRNPFIRFSQSGTTPLIV